MDLLNHHHIREILPGEEPFNITPAVTGLCEPFCDPAVNQSGFCIGPCLSICPNVCRFSILPLVPPPDPPEDSPRKSHHLSSLWITVLVVLATTFVVISCYLIYMRYYSDRYRPRRRRSSSQEQPQTSDDHEDFLDEDHGPELDHPIWYIHTIGLEPSIIGAIAVCRYKRGDGLVEGTECSVCLNEFQDDETLRLLPKCNHAFHIPCIDGWLRAHTNCPMCRAPIVTTIARTAIAGEVEGSREDIIHVTTDDDDGSTSELEILTQALEENEDEGGEASIGGSSKRLENENPTGMQLVRRSVSMRALAATRVSVEIADVALGDPSKKDSAPETTEDNRDQQKGVNDQEKTIIGNSSPGRSLPLPSGSGSAPAPMGRSLSWSGRFLLSKYGRGRGSILPL